MTAAPATAERRVVALAEYRVVLVDSITQIVPADAGAVVVTGSHGGTSAAGFAAGVAARLYVFNDAGVGKDRAGLAGLDLLDRAGIAACAVSHDSARIGDAADTLASGIVSAANPGAAALGIVCGEGLRSALVRLGGAPNRAP